MSEKIEFKGVYPDVQEKGWNDYFQSVPFNKNPYQFFSRSNKNITMSGAWEAGWMKAQKKDKS